MRRVDGAALGDVDVARVGQLAVLGEVVRTDQEWARPSAFGELAADLDVFPGERFDLQDVPVDEPLAVDPEVGVVAGPDDVAGPGVVAVGELDPRVADLVRGGEFGLDDAGQLGGFGVGAREKERVFPGKVVS